MLTKRRLIKYKQRQAGFSLLETTLALSFVIGLTVLLIEPADTSEQVFRHDSLLKTADHELQTFMAVNGRLPCPDHNTDGREDCAGSGVKGDLPYLTLGFKQVGFVAGEVALKYSVYRKPDDTPRVNDVGALVAASVLSSDADLAAAKNRYAPTMSDGARFEFSNINAVDLCAGLNNARSRPLDLARTYVQSSNGSKTNVAYVVATPGSSDGDGANGLFDGFNALTGSAFNSASTPFGPDYDDQVLSRSFTELADIMQCDAMINSLDLMANAVLTQVEVEDLANSAKQSAIIGAALSGTAIGLNVYTGVLAGVDLVNAIQTLSVAAGLLQGAIGGCALVIGCFLIAAYAVSVASAVVGIALSGVALVAAVAATVSQIVGTALYIDVAVRSGSAVDNFGTPDFSANITEMTNNVSNIRTDLLVKKPAAITKRADADQVLNSALAMQTSLGNYAIANDDPVLNQSPAVISSLSNTFLALDQVKTAKTELAGFDDVWQRLKLKCEGLDPVDLGAPECVDAAVAKSNRDQAEAQLNLKFTTANTQLTAAKTTGDNYAVYQGLDVNNVVLSSPCSAVVSCTLAAQVQSAFDDYQLNIKLDAEAKTLEADVVQQEQQIAELEGSIAAMQCVQDGNVFNADTNSCNAPGAASTASLISVGAGGKNILGLVDQRGINQ